MIDGFDPGDTRKTTDCDCEQDTSKDGCFEKNSTGGVFNPKSHESIEDKMLYKNLVNLLSSPISYRALQCHHRSHTS